MDRYTFSFLMRRRTPNVYDGPMTPVEADPGRPPWEPPLSGGETEHLVGALERLRTTFRWKCDGLDEAGLAFRIPSSQLSLGGLLKHLASVEDFTFSEKLRGQWDGEAWGALGYDGTDDWFFTSAAADEADALYRWWDSAVERSRQRLSAALTQSGGLDQLAHLSHGPNNHVSLRRLVFDLVEEYGRHTGHADLIREAWDGRVGEDPPDEWRPASGDYHVYPLSSR